MLTSFIQQRPFAKAGLLAVPLIICIILMGQQFPKQPVAGFQSTIIAFEFVTDTGEVLAILDSLSQEELAGMDRGNYIDFAFMLCYGSFVSLFFWLAYRQFGKPWMQAGIWLGLVVFLGDLLENIQLLNITSAYADGPKPLDLSSFITRLQLFTWIKWVGLAIALVLAGLVFKCLGGIWRWLGLWFGVPLLLSMVALAMHTPIWMERFTASIFLGLGSLVLSCFFIKVGDKSV